MLQARWVSPEILGRFAKYSILTTYLTVALVFVQDGFVRQFSYLIGKGENDKALEIAAVAKVWYLGAAIVFSAILFVLSAYSLVQARTTDAIGWGAQIPVAVAGSYGIYLQNVYRRSMEFKQLSYNGLVASCVSFASLLFVKLFGFVGLAAKVDVTNIVRMALDVKYIPIRVKAAWNLKVFRDLARISIPLSLEGYIRTSFMTATFGYLVVRYCGERDLGLYGIAAAFEGFAMVFVNSLIQMFDVKMAGHYGATDSIRKSTQALVLPTVFGIACSFLLAVCLCVCIGPFVRLCVPKYVDAIPVVYILAFSMPVSVLTLPTRILRVGLAYKAIFSTSIVRVIALVTLVHFVPHRIEWFAGCRIVADLSGVLIGYVVLFRRCFLEAQSESVKS